MTTKTTSPIASKDGRDDFVDRLGNELGRVVDDVIGQAGREPAFHIRQSLEDGIGGLESISARPLEDADRDGALLAQVCVDSVVLCTQLNVADVAQTGHLTVLAGLDNNVLKLTRLHQPAQRLQVHLECARVWHRRLVEHARRHLEILCSHSGGDLRTGHIARRDLVRIEPDAHGVLARAEHLHVAHAVDALEHVDQLQCRVVRNIKLIPRIIRREHMDDHQEVRRVLSRRHAKTAHLLRQSRFRRRDAVLHQHLRLVRDPCQA